MASSDDLIVDRTNALTAAFRDAGLILQWDGNAFSITILGNCVIGGIDLGESTLWEVGDTPSNRAIEGLFPPILKYKNGRNVLPDQSLWLLPLAVSADGSFYLRR